MPSVDRINNSDARLYQIQLTKIPFVIQWILYRCFPKITRTKFAILKKMYIICAQNNGILYLSKASLL